MALRTIVSIPEPVLYRKARAVKKFDQDLQTLIDDMIETMRVANGIGLAANQVGDLRRVIVVDVGAAEETKDQQPLAMINPEVVSVEGSWPMEEGCLSIPGIREEVVRPEAIRVRFRDRDFSEQEISAGGTLGRVILHEIDHLNGVLFIDRLSGVRRKLLRGRLNKIQRGEVEVDYPIVGSTPPATGTEGR